MLCPIKVNSNTIELPVHTSCNCALDLLCVIIIRNHNHGMNRKESNYNDVILFTMKSLNIRTYSTKIIIPFYFKSKEDSKN